METEEQAEARFLLSMTLEDQHGGRASRSFNQPRALGVARPAN